MPKTPDRLFRAARREDAATIAEFQIAMAWETEKLALDPPTCRRGVDAVFDDPSRGRYQLAEVDGQVVGSLLLINEWSDWRNGWVWWIHSLYVLPAHRGQGVFSALYAHVRALAEADPTVRGLRLYVDRTNHSAQAIYARIGMSADHYDLYEWMKAPPARG